MFEYAKEESLRMRCASRSEKEPSPRRALISQKKAAGAEDFIKESLRAISRSAPGRSTLLRFLRERTGYRNSRPFAEAGISFVYYPINCLICAAAAFLRLAVSRCLILKVA